MEDWQMRKRARELRRQERANAELSRIKEIDWGTIDWKAETEVNDRTNEYIIGERADDVITLFASEPTLKHIEILPMDVLNKIWWTDARVTLFDNIRPVAEYYKKAGKSIIEDLEHSYEVSIPKVYCEVHDLIDLDNKEAFAKKHVGNVYPQIAQTYFDLFSDTSDETQDYLRKILNLDEMK